MHVKILALALLTSSLTFAQGGPGRGGPGPGGPRPTPPAAGQPGLRGAIDGLTQAETALWIDGLERFRETDSVSGTQPGANGSGLGPRFNINSCQGCHAHPAPGGTSPQVNPQIAMATNFGATNTVPAFLRQNGPVRVVRFVRNPDRTPDGGVHALFTIAGRSDAPGCTLAQPDFAAAVAQNNAVFRIPTPLFGAGLMEAISDSAILANKAANAAQKAALGISGRENRNGNDGTITRFGWKAQNKSLELFSAEAYNVEQGVTNAIFPNERDDTPGCATNATPEDTDDVTAFANFMRFLAPPQPAPETPSIANGRQLFSQIGCAACHTPSLTTGNARSAALRNKQAQLYSDLLLHRMGQALADGVDQGQARGDEWRTAPLWGLGQRLFFLHDGRTGDLTEAIDAHASQQSEANAVVTTFHALSAAAKQDLINFLKSL